MNKLSKENVFLLLVVFLAALGAFSYFPYITTSLVEYLGLRPLDMASMIGIAMLVGNIGAYLITLSISAQSIKAKLLFGYVVLAVSVAVMIFAGSLTSMWCMLVATGSIVAYRFAISLTSNLMRAAQLQYLPDKSHKSQLFAYIKLSTSLGAALGPVLGSLLIERAGMQGVLILVTALFVVTVILLSVKMHAQITHGEPAARRSLWQNIRMQPRAIYLLSTAAMLHFVFEAQIYSSIAINIKNNTPSYLELLALLFTANAVLLVVLVVPLLRIIDKYMRTFHVLIIASLCSLIAILASQSAHTEFGILVIALLFTIGEIVTPQILIDKVTDLDHAHDAVGAIATYNFFTFGVGLSLGYWLSGVLSNGSSMYFSSTVWIGVYLLFILMLTYSRKYLSDDTLKSVAPLSKVSKAKIAQY